MSGVPCVLAVSDAQSYTVTLRDGHGHHWLADESPAEGGADHGPAPHALLLSSLGACTAITLRMYAARKRWTLHSVEVELRFNPNGPPAEGVSLIERRIRLQGALDGEQRERLLQIANKCPLHRVLTGEVRIASSLA
jgi:putative redox protein